MTKTQGHHPPSEKLTRAQRRTLRRQEGKTLGQSAWSGIVHAMALSFVATCALVAADKLGWIDLTPPLTPESRSVAP